jgi:hypothetical protein
MRALWSPTIYPTYTSVQPAITTQAQVVFNGKLGLVWLVVSPANHRASADRFEIASGAHPPRIAIATGQPKETQDRCVAGGAHTTNEVGIVAAQRVGSWACVPQRVRRASSPRGGQVCQHVLHLLPERPIKASRSLECGHELLQLSAARANLRRAHVHKVYRTHVLEVTRGL